MTKEISPCQTCKISLIMEDLICPFLHLLGLGWWRKGAGAQKAIVKESKMTGGLLNHIMSEVSGKIQWVWRAECVARTLTSDAAGVWRRKTIVAVGGWKSRTTVEDMDLSLRTYVNGWKAIYLNDVVCVKEVS